MRDGIPCHLASAVVAGVTATFVASPVDVVKTRFMNAPRGRYSGVLDCARQTALKEGAGAFYRLEHITLELSQSKLILTLQGL